MSSGASQILRASTLMHFARGLRASRSWRIGWKLALAATILAALLAPSIVGMYRQAGVRREIERLEGAVLSKYRLGFLPGGRRLEFGPIDTVALQGPHIDDQSLEVLQKIPELRSLTLTNTRITDRGLAQLARFHKLGFLSLMNVDFTKLIGPRGARLNTTPLITGTGLAALEGLTELEMIQLSSAQTTDSALRAIKRIKSLKMLDLVGTSITDSAVADFKSACPLARSRGGDIALRPRFSQTPEPTWRNFKTLSKATGQPSAPFSIAHTPTRDLASACFGVRNGADPPSPASPRHPRPRVGKFWSAQRCGIRRHQRHLVTRGLASASFGVRNGAGPAVTSVTSSPASACLECATVRDPPSPASPRHPRPRVGKFWSAQRCGTRRHQRHLVTRRANRPTRPPRPLTTDN